VVVNGLFLSRDNQITVFYGGGVRQVPLQLVVVPAAEVDIAAIAVLKRPLGLVLRVYRLESDSRLLHQEQYARRVE